MSSSFISTTTALNRSTAQATMPKRFILYRVEQQPSWGNRTWIVHRNLYPTLHGAKAKARVLSGNTRIFEYNYEELSKTVVHEVLATLDRPTSPCGGSSSQHEPAPGST